MTMLTSPIITGALVTISCVLVTQRVAASPIETQGEAMEHSATGEALDSLVSVLRDSSV